MTDTKASSEGSGGGNRHAHLSCCIECGANIMSAKDSVAGIVCMNEACRERAPQRWQEMEDDLADIKGSMEEMIVERDKAEKILRFIHENLKRDKDKKGEEIGSVVLPQSMIDAIDEIFIM